MSVKQTFVLLRHREIENIDQLDVYQANGGFESFKKIVTKQTPADVIQVVSDSGLRGRGGAGFPTGRKWQFIPNDIWPHYVVANADESEPGTFKDREIMEKNPFQYLEGLMIASYAVGANLSYTYLRGEFWPVAAHLDRCTAELEQAGLLGENLFGTDYSLRLRTHLGAGAYICGEETALLESLEGYPGQPRLKPPFPAVVGLFEKPTVINNIETLTSLPLIVEKGCHWYRAMGTKDSSGTKVFSLSGCVEKPGNYELQFGATFRDLIYGLGGGPPEGRKVKAIMTAGASSVVLPVPDDEFLDTPMAYETLGDLGAPLGSASVIVLDEDVNLAWLVQKTCDFFKHESCGKCTPCREGCFWMKAIIDRLMAGEGQPADIDLLRDVALQIRNKTLCPLGEFASVPVVSAIDNFRADFEAMVRS
jgi:NADH-quinone oxidoreductase subunit F